MIRELPPATAAEAKLCRRSWILTSVRAHYQIFRSLEVLIGVNDEQVYAALATEVVFGAIVTVRSRLLFADSQPDQGTAAVLANESFHCLVFLRSWTTTHHAQP